jgi:transcriptional regulator with XRE-family HTH domain
MSREVLLEKLTDQTYRDAFISEEIDIGLPMQLRAMREERGWNQQYVAAKMETKQPRFSLMEKPGYGNFSLNTLKKLASIFNVGLIVSFVPFSEMIEFTNAFSRKRLAIPSFADEYSAMERRFSGSRRATDNTLQPSFDFTAGTAIAAPTSGGARTPSVPASYVRSASTSDLMTIPVTHPFILTAQGEQTYVTAIA